MEQRQFSTNLTTLESLVLGFSQQFKDVITVCQAVATTNVAVHLSGETGTGKSCLARLLHTLSLRGSRRFIELNCASIPENMIEAELFGYVRGAFTGANLEKPGRFELADNGTFFLDEVSELSSVAQASLLQAIQEKAFWRLGDTRERYADVRIITASNQNLAKCVEAKKFREDLFYRINVFPICCPPLRERREDIPQLVEHFLRQFSAECRKPVAGITVEAMSMLESHSWPGNIRQLQNVILRAVITAKEPQISVKDLSFGDLSKSDSEASQPIDSSIFGGDFHPDVLVRAHFTENLKRHDWNILQSAKSMSICRSTLSSRMVKWGLKKPSSR